MKSSYRSLLIGALLLPRVLRFIHPDVQIEDPNYIYGAFLILKGFRPFLDFAQPNPPLLESLIAPLYMLFGVSYRIPELLTALAFFGQSILIWRLGSRWFSERAGVLASLIFAWHFLPFRYHLFEREIFATLALSGALLLLARSEPSVRQAWSAGVLAALAYACKQTALVPFAGMLVAMLITPSLRRAAIRTALVFAGMLGIMTALYSALYGVHYLRQTFWFHFIKGAVAPWNVKAFWTLGALGFAAPAALAAIAFLLSPSRSRIWIPFALLSADLVFFWFVTGAFWPHYLLSTLVPVTLLAGYALDAILSPTPTSYRRILAAILIAIPLGTILSIEPALLIGKGAVEHFGFQGTPRHEIAACGEFVRAHSDPSDLMTSDPFIALESQRIEVVNFKDNWGLVLWMNEMIERGEYRSALETMSRSTFGDIRVASHRYWMPQVEQAFRDGRIGVIIPNYELPLSPEWMETHGFKRGFRNSAYDVWIRQVKSEPADDAPDEPIRQ